jgi:16S rRNA (guanine966-N2)-methyltransferase
MIRIVGGSARGRRMKVPAEGTRPTSERAREALFNSLQSLIGPLEDAHVLDLYAGSGAVGLEALSRGAAEATFVEQDRAAAKLISANAVALALEGATVHQCSVGSYLASSSDSYDLIFADPPYSVTNDELAAVIAELLQGHRLRSEGVVVVERSVRSGTFSWPVGVGALKHKRYGECVLWYGQQQ